MIRHIRNKEFKYELNACKLLERLSLKARKECHHRFERLPVKSRFVQVESWMTNSALYSYQTDAKVAGQVLVTEGNQAPEGLLCRHVH